MNGASHGAATVSGRVDTLICWLRNSRYCLLRGVACWPQPVTVQLRGLRPYDDSPRPHRPYYCK